MAGRTSDGQGGQTCKQGDKKCYDDLFSEKDGKEAPGVAFAAAVQGVAPVSPHDSPTAPSVPSAGKGKDQGMSV
ncbi:MAG: hypothetical protein EAZ52_01060 [Alphaproteobacteria bacterium]|nr:MAG: hypothetical protein EAZ52_01060 [Alphaproteobacteria bacterium]